MNFNFADLKKQSGQNAIEKLNEEASKFKSGNFAKDERLWSPELDKAGEGSAVIRFLPAPPGENVPFIRKFSYGFKVGQKWFIENSPSTIGLPCPIMEYNSSLWDSGDEAKKELARQRKRRTGFMTNIYVVSHKNRPSDEGKVFLYEFGKKIWEKLDDKMNPAEDEVEQMNPFDLWSGANFRLRIAQVAGFRNYDKSEFLTPGPLSKDDSELERIWKQCHSLQAEIAPDKFKSYDELKRKLDSMLGGGNPNQRARDDESYGARGASNEKQESSDDDTPWKDDEPKSGGGGGDLDWLQSLAKD